jgi:hypothetical protein
MNRKQWPFSLKLHSLRMLFYEDLVFGCHNFSEYTDRDARFLKREITFNLWQRRLLNTLVYADR